MSTAVLHQLQRDLEALLSPTCPPGQAEQAARLLLDAYQAGRLAGIVEAIGRVSSQDDRDRLRGEMLPPVKGHKRPDLPLW